MQGDNVWHCTVVPSTSTRNIFSWTTDWRYQGFFYFWCNTFFLIEVLLYSSWTLKQHTSLFYVVIFSTTCRMHVALMLWALCPFILCLTTVDCDHVVQQKLKLAHDGMDGGFVTCIICMPNLIWIVVFCDPKFHWEFYWGRPVGYGKCGVLHSGSSNLCIQQLTCHTLWASSELIVMFIWICRWAWWPTDDVVR